MGAPAGADVSAQPYWPNETPWSPLTQPIDPLDSVRISAIQSAGTKGGKRMDWQEAREIYEARAYEREQMQDGRELSDDIHYADRRG